MHTRSDIEPTQLPTSADNVALPAFAAARRAAARLLLTAHPPRVKQSINISCPPGQRQQTRSSSTRLPNGTDRQTDGQTPDSCIDPAPHTMRTVPPCNGPIWPISLFLRQRMLLTVGMYNQHITRHAVLFAIKQCHQLINNVINTQL